MRPKTSGGCWDPEVHLANHKIVIRQIGRSPLASLLLDAVAVTGNIFTVRAETLEDEKFLLGVINSSLAAFYWRIMFVDFKDSFPQVTIFSLNQLPIRKKNQKNDNLIKKVKQSVDAMLALHRAQAAAQSPHEKDALAKQITATDRQIDALVYQLYALTPKKSPSSKAPQPNHEPDDFPIPKLPLLFLFLRITAHSRPSLTFHDEAKFWLTPKITLAVNLGLKPAELKTVRTHSLQHEYQIKAAWKKHFG